MNLKNDQKIYLDERKKYNLKILINNYEQNGYKFDL